MTARAADRYRDAVLQQSRWLPAYLSAVDAADVTLRAARAVRRRPIVAGVWDEPDPGTAAVLSAGLSVAGELSLVLTGPPGWRRSVGGAALVSGGERVALDGGLLEHAAERVRLCVPLPLEQLAPGRWQVQLVDPAGVPVPDPTPPLAGGWCRAVDFGRPDGPDDSNRGMWLAGEPGAALVLIRAAGAPATVEHRVDAGIARLTIRWTPPAGTPPQLLLLDTAGTVVGRVDGVASTGDFTLSAVLDTVPTEGGSADTLLTVAVPGDEAPRPLVLAPGAYPLLSDAPRHGAVRLGGARVRARYDTANRLQLRIMT